MTASTNVLPSTAWLRRWKDAARRWQRRRDATRHEVEVMLSPHEVYRLPGDPRGSTIIALWGRLWLTQANQSGDIVLSPRQAWTVAQPGLVLVEALSPAAFRLTRS